jgi:hypothetical protein
LVVAPTLENGCKALGGILYRCFPKDFAREGIGFEQLQPGIDSRRQVEQVGQDGEKSSGFINVSSIATPAIAQGKGGGIRASTF